MVTETKTDPINARAVAARNGDLAVYAEAVHGLKIEPYQLAWEEALETMNRVVIVCPPDTYKSTTVRLFLERAIGKNHDIRCLWLMNTGEQATKQAMTISNTISGNNVYRRAFNVREDQGAQWTKSVLFVERSYVSPDPTLMASGINGPYQGLHFDLIVIDDPTNQEDVHSDTTMEMQRQKVRGVILDRLVKGGRIVVILTRWGENDLVPTFEDMGFTIIRMPVAGNYPWGPTLSVERFPPEDLERIKRDKGDILFSLTFMCAPEALAGNIIKRENFRYWSKDNLPVAPLQLFMGVDPAASLKTYRDYSAVATVGLDIKTRKKYLVDLVTRRMETPDLEDLVVKLAKHMAGLRAIGFETDGFQLSLVQGIKRRHHIPIEEIPYRTRRNVARKVRGMDRSKIGRAMWLNSLFTAGLFFLPRDLPMVEGISLESELCAVPLGKHDDRMDAIAIACTMADSAMPSQNMKVRMGAW
jgi:phage terminase large subunit-like protein